MSTEKQSGLTGTLGGVKSLGQLVQMLAPYFAPASLFQPPGSNAEATGGRTLALTNKQSGAPSTTPPIDRAVIALSAGTLTWQFSQSFKNPPVVVALVQGADYQSPTGYPYGIHQQPGSVTNTAVIINSDDPADSRLVSLAAIGNPD